VPKFIRLLNFLEPPENAVISNTRFETGTGLEPDAAARVEALIDITRSLNAIFEEENSALTDSRPGDIAPLQADKARLAAAYAQAVRFVAAERSAVGAVGASLLAQLRLITETFEAHAARQHSLLDGPAR
jgi:hypothetical protein